MDFSLHITFIVCILLFIFIVYGAWFKDFGQKHYEIVRRFPFFSVFMPKTVRAYVIVYKVQVVTSLLVLIIAYIFLLIRSD